MLRLILLMLAACGSDSIGDRANADRAPCIDGEWPYSGPFSAENCAAICTPKPAEATAPIGYVCPGSRIVEFEGEAGACRTNLERGGLRVDWFACESMDGINASPSESELTEVINRDDVFDLIDCTPGGQSPEWPATKCSKVCARQPSKATAPAGMTCESEYLAIVDDILGACVTRLEFEWTVRWRPCVSQ